MFLLPKNLIKHASIANIEQNFNQTNSDIIIYSTYTVAAQL